MSDINEVEDTISVISNQLEETNYFIDNEFETGDVELPEEYDTLLPKDKGKAILNKKTYLGIMANHPEPTGGRLKPSELGPFLTARLSETDRKKDEERKRIQRNILNTIKPYISIKTRLESMANPTEEVKQSIKYAEQGILLAINQVAKIESQRREDAIKNLACRPTKELTSEWSKRTNSNPRYLLPTETETEIKTFEETQRTTKNFLPNGDRRQFQGRGGSMYQGNNLNKFYGRNQIQRYPNNNNNNNFKYNNNYNNYNKNPTQYRNNNYNPKPTQNAEN